MANLKLHRDEADQSPQGFFGKEAVGEAPSRCGEPRRGWEPRLAGRPAADDLIRHAESALDRVDRAMANLRELMGEGFEGPDGPRAA